MSIAETVAAPPRLPNTIDGANSIGDPTIQWLTEAVAESEAFLAAQPGYDQIGKAIDAIMSTDETESWDPKSSLSQTKTNRVAKIAEDLAALLTDTKPFWDYSVANRRFEQHAQIYGKLATFWYQRQSIDLRLADAIKYYVAAGSGYLHLYYDADQDDICACAEDPRNVLPIRPVNYESLESCQGVILKRKVPVNYIQDRYGVDVKADSDGSALSWLSKVRDSAADVMSPIWKFRKSGTGEPDIPRIPTVTLYTCYLKDPRTNESSKPKEMGQWMDQDQLDGSTKRVPANNWSYEVKKGEKLYPHRRMIVWVGNNILYDGPCFYWHDRFPIIKICLNPYPWTWLGKAPIWDLLRLQTSLNRLLRVVDDHAAQVAQPGSIHDKTNVSKSSFDTFNTRRAGWKIFQNPLAGKGIQIITPPPLDAAIWEHIKWIIEEMGELSGLADATRMMDLKQIPNNSTVESILNTFTPSLRFRSRILESVAREIAMQLAYNFSQYCTLSTRVVILGPGGITQDDFDFDPGSLMPDYVHDGDFEDGQITADALLRGPLPKYDRAKEFLRRVIFKISPASLLNTAQMERTLIYFQLARAGWLDIITLLEQLNVPNIGVEQLPDNVRTILDRLQWQQQMGLGMEVNPAGAKASGQSPPRIVTKES